MPRPTYKTREAFVRLREGYARTGSIVQVLVMLGLLVLLIETFRSCVGAYQ